MKKCIIRFNSNSKLNDTPHSTRAVMRRSIIESKCFGEFTLFKKLSNPCSVL